MTVLPRTVVLDLFYYPNSKRVTYAFVFRFVFALVLTLLLSSSSSPLRHSPYCKFFLLHIHSMHSPLLIILYFSYWFHWWSFLPLLPLFIGELAPLFCAKFLCYHHCFVVTALHHRFRPSRTRLVVFLIF